MFSAFVVTHDFCNYIPFTTHASGLSLDPVVTGLSSQSIQCFLLGFVDSSDHVIVRTKNNFRKPREKSNTRTLWNWDFANWENLSGDLRGTDWGRLLIGDVEEHVLVVCKCGRLDYA